MRKIFYALSLALGFTISPVEVHGQEARPISPAQVCQTKWGRDARHVSLSMKKEVFRRAGLPWSEHSHYEVDHMIPRELGGADSLSNLWAQPWTGPWNAHMKDRLENKMHREVCLHHVTLEWAQEIFRTQDGWKGAYVEYFGTP